MRIVFYFILLFNICNLIGESVGSEDFWKYLHSGIYRGNILKYNAHHHSHEDHHHHHIIHPCSVHDLSCVRRVFAHNSKCKPVKGPAPDPYMLRRLDLHIPQANLTFSLLIAQVKGLNDWKIKTFFINKATDTLVLEVEFDKIVVASPGAKTTCHRKGKETIEEIDYSIIEYYGISFTLTIPHIKDLNLSNGYVFTYVPDAKPLYTLGPAVAGNRDPDFIKSVRVWLHKLDITMREVWAIQGPPFFSTFFQSTICDFRHH